MLSDIWFFFISHAFINPALLFIETGNILKWVTRWWVAKKLRNHEHVKMLQQDLHKLYEDAEIEPSLCYSQICQIMYTAAFFQPILPLGTLLSLFGMIFTYYGYKKKILYDIKKPVKIGSELTYLTLYMLNGLPVVYAVLQYFLTSAWIHHIRSTLQKRHQSSIMDRIRIRSGELVVSFLPDLH